jgi:hypothetical protein
MASFLRLWYAFFFSELVLIFLIHSYHITLQAIWNWTLYDGSWYCLAPVWSVPLAFITASYTVWKKGAGRHEQTRVVPLDHAYPQGEEISEDEFVHDDDTSSSSSSSSAPSRRIIHRTSSARSFHGAKLVPVADVVIEEGDGSVGGVGGEGEEGEAKEGSDGDDGYDVERTAVLISPS